MRMRPRLHATNLAVAPPVSLSGFSEMAHLDLGVVLLAILNVVHATPSSPDDGTTVFSGPCVFSIEKAENTTSNRCVPRHTVLLGGLFPIHTWKMDEQYPLGGYCSSFFSMEGFQRMEAMRFAVDRVNADDIIPGVKLAFEIRDTCLSEEHTKQQAVRFVNRGIAPDGGCNLTRFHPISGVVGAASSSNSRAAADILGLFRIPQISYSSSSARLSDKDRYGYFLRTVPPDNYQAEAMISLVDALNASYFSLLYSSGTFGNDGAAEIRQAAARHGSSSPGHDAKCIAADRNIGSNTVGVPDHVYEAALDDVVSEVGKNASVVIAFAGIESVAQLLSKAKRYKNRFSDHHLWIAADSWATSGRVASPQLGEIAQGTLGVYPLTVESQDFNKHFLALHPSNNVPGPTGNPWIGEFWRTVFDCDPYSLNETERIDCQEHTLTNSTYQHKPSQKAPLVIDAVLAFAHAIRQLQLERCGPHAHSVCAAMLSSDLSRGEAIDGRALLTSLHSLKYNNSAGSLASFSKTGDPERVEYVITNLQKDATIDRYHFARVGFWEQDETDSNDHERHVHDDGILHTSHCHSSTSVNTSSCPTMFHLDLNLTAIQWHNGQFSTWPIPSSRCSSYCPPGHFSYFIGSPFPPRTSRCCWKCQRCQPNWKVPTQFDQCQSCPPKQRANDNQTQCLDLKVDFWSISDAVAIFTVVMAALGIGTTIITGVVAISVHHLLPQHSMMQIEPLLQSLTGIIGLFVCVCVALSKPVVSTCLLVGVLNGVFWTILIGPLCFQMAIPLWLNWRGTESRAYSNVNTPVASQIGTDSTIATSQACSSGSRRNSLESKGTVDTEQSVRIDSACTSNVSMIPIVDRDHQVLVYNTGHATLLLAALLGFHAALITLSAVTGPPDVKEEVDANRRWTIYCEYGLPMYIQMGFNSLLILLTAVLRFYCMTKKIALHPTANLVALTMVSVLVMLLAGGSLSLIFVAKTRSAIWSIVQIAIAYTILFIVLLPDLFRTLAPSKTPQRNRPQFYGAHRSKSSSEGGIEVVIAAVQTLHDKSLFNQRVRWELGDNSSAVVAMDASSLAVSPQPAPAMTSGPANPSTRSLCSNDSLYGLEGRDLDAAKKHTEL